MCGIVGIVGHHEVAPILVEALKRLEYRGYDSAGIATLHQGALGRRRAVGKLIQLSDLLVRDPIRGSIGIGHTRWATHGQPTHNNAHPHQSGRVAVVHNGIIENYRELRADLESPDRPFVTETDSEAIAYACNRYLENGLTPTEAARATLGCLKGAFAICFLFEGEDNLLIAARRGSPLAVGYGEGENFVGSDALALGPLTHRIAYLDEGDHAILTRTTIDFFDSSNTKVSRNPVELPPESYQVDKGRHRHFMAREIHDQPSVIADALTRYLSTDHRRVDTNPAVDFTNCSRVVLVACGTAHYACHVAKYWFESLAKMPVEIEVASEFRYREPPVTADTIGIFVSQSGETADTLAALRYVRSRGSRVYSVVNVETSTIARESDVALPILAGPEIGVASTKAFTCQIAVLATLAILAGRQKGYLTETEEAELCTALCDAPGLMARTIELEPRISEIAKEVAKAQDVLFLGRGAMYPIALEGALKLKEISYIHAEGYASGELKHGPIALVDESVPVVVLCPNDVLIDKSLSNMQEVLARDGKVLLISDSNGIARGGQDVWQSLELPACAPFIAPLIYAVPMQLLAYHCAIQKGTDVDQPRNLAKSVTVE